MADHLLDEELKLSSAEGSGEQEPIKVKLVAHEPETANVEKIDEQKQYTDDTETVHSFKLGKEIGSGTLGKVMLANNTGGGPEFTVKCVSKEFARNADDVQTLLKSLQKAAEIVNPHLSSYYGSGEHQGSVYAVSDFIKGRTLKDVISAGEFLHVDRFIDVFRQVCLALKSLHRQNIVHGDLKPSNIFLVNTESGHDFIKVVDFGIAGAFGEEQRHEFLRKSGAAYLSPEQCLGYAIDARSDIYSLGLIMFETLTGRPFVDGQTAMHSVLKQLNSSARKGMQNSGIPESLQQIIVKCLEKNRSQRYFSIDDLDLDLELVAASQTNLEGIAEQWTESNDSKIKNAKTQEDKIKLILSAVICAGVVGCIAMAIANVYNSITSLSQNNNQVISDAPFLGPNYPPYASEALREIDENPPTDSLSSLRAAESAISQAVTPANSTSTIGPQDAFTAMDNGSDPIAQRTYQLAERMYALALKQYKRENTGRTDSDMYKQQLAGIQAGLGETYMRAAFSTMGGRLDRKTFYKISTVAGPLVDSSIPVMLYPSFPGLIDSTMLLPDYKNAEMMFEQAAQTLDNHFTPKHLDFLWDMAFTKFQMGKIDESIDYHRKIIDVLKSQSAPDKNALIMTYDGIGRLYLWSGQFGKAVHEFKIARKLDKEAFRIYGTGEHTNQVRADLAYAFFMEGKLREADRIASQNLRAIDSLKVPYDADNESTELNLYVLSKVLRQQGKFAEANAIDLRAYRMNNYAGPVVGGAN